VEESEVYIYPDEVTVMKFHTWMGNFGAAERRLVSKDVF
jgi:hypothetical protein